MKLKLVILQKLCLQSEQTMMYNLYGNALQNNEIDTIGTDHVANQLKLKLGGDDVWSALAGFPGIGTSLPIILSEGINKNRINLNQLVNLTSTNSAKIFGLSGKGSLEKGFDADITMIDLKKEEKVSPELFGGFSDYLVYDGWNLERLACKNNC